MEDSRPSLVDIVRAVDLNLIGLLQKEQSLKAVRLVCRELRGLVDTGICSANVVVRAEDEMLWESGSRLPLSRWTRCSDMCVGLGFDVRDARLLALPFVGQPLEARQQITSLSLGWSPPGTSGALLSSLLRSLPSLRAVSLRSMPWDALDQHMVYDALASLQHLDELSLPSDSSLSRVHLLAGKLRRLAVSDVSIENPSMAQNMVSSVMQLPQLQELRLPNGLGPEDGFGVLRMLLSRQHPSLRMLELKNTMRIRLSGGKVTSIQAMPWEVCLADVARVVSRSLLPSGAVGERLERVLLPAFRLWAPCRPGAWGSGMMEESDLGQLQSLLRRCERAEVGYLCVNDTVSRGMVLKALDALGDAVQELRLWIGFGDSEFRVRLGQPAVRAGAAPSTADVHAGAAALAAAAATALRLRRQQLQQHEGCDAPPLSVVDLALEFEQMTIESAEAAAAEGDMATGGRGAWTDGGSAGDGDGTSECEDFALRSILRLREPLAVLRARLQEPGALRNGTLRIVQEPVAGPLDLKASLSWTMCQVAPRSLDDECFSAGWGRQQRLEWVLEQWEDAKAVVQILQ